MTDTDEDRSNVSRRRLLAGASGAAILGVAGCLSAPTNPGTTTGSGETTVAVTLADYKIELSKTSLLPGTVTFDITNSAGQVHEFVVFATDLAPDELPTTDGGNKVDEEGQGLTKVDEAADIEGGASTTLTVDLDPGHYVAICNLPGHYKLGMRTAFTVE